MVPQLGAEICHFNEGQKLRSRSGKDIRDFLKGLAVQKGIEPLQVDQDRKALIFLYGDFFKLTVRVPELTGKTKGKASEVMGLKGGEPNILDRIGSKTKLQIPKTSYLF